MIKTFEKALKKKFEESDERIKLFYVTSNDVEELNHFRFGITYCSISVDNEEYDFNHCEFFVGRKEIHSIEGKTTIYEINMINEVLKELNEGK